MTARHRPATPPIAADAHAAVRDRLVQFAAWAFLAAAWCALLTVAGVASALAWHLVRWAWTERAQLIVLLLVILTGAFLWRMDQHARDEQQRNEP